MFLNLFYLLSIFHITIICLILNYYRNRKNILLLASETAFTPELCEFNDYIAGIQSNDINSQSKELDWLLHFLGEEITLKIEEFTNAQYQ